MAKKIVVVEDEEILNKSLTEVLLQEGYEVFSALDGEAGLDLIYKERPDLILLDIILPKLNGFDILKKVKSDEDFSKTPVMILTNLGDLDDIKKALDYGTVTYLVKVDFHLKDIVKKVKQALSE